MNVYLVIHQTPPESCVKFITTEPEKAEEEAVEARRVLLTAKFGQDGEALDDLDDLAINDLWCKLTDESVSVVGFPMDEYIPDWQGVIG
jgi:hypothetical protein